MDRSKFRFTHRIRVRNYEVDWQGIVHNANYLLYFEVARIEYLRHIGVKVDMESIQQDSKVVLVRNEIDYRSAAHYDELLEVLTRVSYIRNSSFAFEGIMYESETGRLVAENLAIHVWIDPLSNQPFPVSDRFREMVRSFEGENLQFLSSELPR